MPGICFGFGFWNPWQQASSPFVRPGPSVGAWLVAPRCRHRVVVIVSKSGTRLEGIEKKPESATDRKLVPIVLACVCMCVCV